MMNLKLGALSDPISKQLTDAGVKHLPKNIDMLDRLADAITLCAIRSIITESECHKARKRLMAMIVRAVRAEGEP